ncbi:hypothetical protein GPICK_07825 [Geobacter pickeringii]|uniref:Glycine zipper domain-containing protein n=1 Tax=Geobacter pickeringii TaxID=345632 RepID=A0A0B5BEI9_9BACT|nr:hypothetical protein GPICK_07825 [Geobacter pickeringii]
MIAVMLAVTAVPSHAEEGGFEGIFRNALYGGLAGALVGGALLAFTHRPADHLDYLGYGAAGGILAGAAYGTVRAATALAEVENGSVKIAMPTIVPDYVPARGSRTEGGVIISAQVLRGKF